MNQDMEAEEEEEKSGNEDEITSDQSSATLSKRGDTLNFKCILCLSQVKNPATTDCGHIFCWTCIVEWCGVKVSSQYSFFSK